ncbi:hypothetical protein, partial [Cetobacterium sp.]|uniref:hypothetical protein n=1 Tax=Cetobacterium sp. TaxID=2071632 RepID=UPI003F352BE0
KKEPDSTQREQNEGKALATPKSGPPKKGVPRWGMPEGGLGGKSGGGGPSPHIFYGRKEPVAYFPYLCLEICAWPQARSRRIPALTGGGISEIKNYLYFKRFSFTNIYLKEMIS